VPAPPNVDFAHATDLGTLTGSTPNVVTQDCRDSGTNYTLYFKYLAVTGDNVVGAFPFGDLISYRPTTTVYRDTTETITLSVNRCLQIPVTAGTTYYFKVAPNTIHPPPYPTPSDNTTLTFSLYRHLDTTVPDGSLIINDDGFSWGEFPASVLSSATGSVVAFQQGIPPSERLDCCHVGRRLLVADVRDDTTALFDLEYTALATLPYDTTSSALASNRSTRFYIGTLGDPYQSPIVPAVVHVVAAADGTVVGSPITLPSAGYGLFFTMGVNSTDTVLYYTGTNDARGSPSTIKRWDLVNGALLTDLAVGPTSGAVVDYSLMVLSDDTIVALWSDLITGTVVTRLIHYATNGTVLANHLLNTICTDDSAPRVCPAEDDLTAVWVWERYGSGNTSQFSKVQISDGAILTQFQQVQFEHGVYAEDATATPVDTWGHSESCFFAAIPGIPNETGTIALTAPGLTSSSLTSGSALGLTGYVLPPRHPESRCPGGT
jgi:hypothetical protein